LVVGITGWLSLGFAGFTALFGGSRTAITAFAVAAACFGLIALGLGTHGISRDRSALGTAFAMSGLIVAIALLLTEAVLRFR